MAVNAPTKEQILGTLLPFLNIAERCGTDELEEKLPPFSLEDIVGKTLSGTSRIKNPRPYNPEIEANSPKEYLVLTFSDGSYILHALVGWQDGTISNSFFVHNGIVGYSSRLLA